MMADYFLTAANEAAMKAVLRAVWETNNPALPDGVEPPEYSEQGWVVHGFIWTLTPGIMSADGTVAQAPAYKPGYHALLRVHGAGLGPISQGLLAAAGIEVLDASALAAPPLAWR